MRSFLKSPHFLLHDRILDKVSKSKQVSAVGTGINLAVNRLGELGFYQFRDLLT
jgi:hypothetical protein